MTKRSRSLRGSVVELGVVVALALGVALVIQAFLVKPYRIPSGSMLPTLHIDQRILVNRIGTHFSSPRIGDIIVFHPPKDYDLGCANPNEGADQIGQGETTPCAMPGGQPASVTFVKRVVGGPGDRIAIRNGHVIRNGAPERDPYIVPCNDASSCNFRGTITIRRGDYYMMGDNRPDSEDSRFWGPVPRAWIIGTAFFTYWPPGRLGFL